MTTSLVISGSLNADGDGLARFLVVATGAKFSAETLAWGYPDQLLELADLLTKFPQTPNSRMDFKLGSAKSGTCGLEFFCFDGVGHTAVSVSIEASDSFRSTDRFNRSEISIRIEPSAIDSFVASLKEFHSGRTNEARLLGIPEY